MGTNAGEDQPVGRPGDITAFTLGDRVISVSDVMRAAFFRGDLQSPWEELLLKKASHDHAVTNALEAESDSLQSRADRFRYERDLITTEETEQWLEKRRLGSPDFAAFVLRSHWKDSLDGKISPQEEEFSFIDPENEAELTVELFLNAGFSSRVKALAWRMASRREGDEADPGFAEQIEDQRTEFFSRMGSGPGDLDEWLRRAGGDATWFEEMLAIEAAYDREVATIVTPDQLSRALRSQRLAMMRLEVEEIEFDTMEAAREAILCVREDNLSMKEVAEDSRYPYFERDFLLEELPDDWQMPLFSTPENGLAGPFSEEDLLRLFRVRRKVEPTIEDEEVRERLEERLIQLRFDEVTAAQGLKSLWIRAAP